MVALTLLGAAVPAGADLLDELRKIDINDYAIGIGVFTNDSIDVAGDTSTWIYPYVPKFSPTDFDSEVLFQRARGYGVRWLNEDWEAGAVARVQTLGFGANASAALGGLEDRGWTAEIGPTVGWRRWPVHVDWTVLADVFSHHSGTNQVLRTSRPVLLERAYVVPELALNYYGASYVDYYFGVPTAAARAARAAYTASSARGPSLGVAWGIRVKPNWLITGEYSIERLGSAIADSPLVATNERRSFSVQLAYDGALFHELAESTFAGGRGTRSSRSRWRTWTRTRRSSRHATSPARRPAISAQTRRSRASTPPCCLRGDIVSPWATRVRYIPSPTRSSIPSSPCATCSSLTVSS